MVGVAVGVEGVPDRDRHAEVALPAHAPVERQVLGPVAIANLHEVGMPAHLRTLREERLLLVEQAHEPLARRHQLEGPVALLVELDGVLDRLGLALQRRTASRRAAGGVAQQLRHRLAGLLDPLARKLGVTAIRRLGVEARERLLAEADLQEPSIALDQLAQRQPLRAPPLEVGGIAEGAYHQDAGAFLGIRELAREDRNRHAEERRHGPAPEEVPVALVVRVGRDTHAGGQQLGTRRRDHEAALSALHAELDVVERAALHAVFHLRLRHCGLEVHVPCGGGVRAVEVPLLPEVQEAELRQPPRALADGLVQLGPVDGEAHAAEQLFERLLVLRRHPLAQGDEVGPRHEARRLLALLGAGGLDLELGLDGGVRIAAHVEVVLHAALGRKTVVVPAHGIVDVAAQHPLLAHHDVGVCVGEDVADVQRARHRGRRCVHHEGLVPRALGIPAVGAAPLPLAVPALLGGGRVEVLGELGGIDRTEAAHGGRGVA